MKAFAILYTISDVQLHTQTANRISHGDKHYVVTNKFLNVRVYSYKPTLSKKA